MKRNTLLLLLGLLTLTLTLPQDIDAQGNSNRGINKNQLSLQERIVRYAYRKVYTYGLAGSIDRNKFIKRVPDEAAVRDSIRFQLNNFRIAPIEQIKNVRIFDLSTPPTGEIVQLSPTDTQINDRRKNRVEQFFSLTAQWTPGQYSSGMDRNLTLEEVMKTYPAKFSHFESYALYEVTVFLEGKTRTYRALALFPSVNRSTRNQKPEFLDNIVGFGGAITNVFKEFKEPKGFFRVKQNRAAVNGSGSQKPYDLDGKKTANNSGNSDTGAVSFSNISYNKNKQGPCFLYDALWGISCNCLGASPVLDQMLTGDPNWDWRVLDILEDEAMCLLQTEMRNPGGTLNGEPEYCPPRHTVRPSVSGFRSDNSYHVTGRHAGSALLSGSCFQDERCNNICEVLEQVPPSISETGEITEYIYYHQGAKKSQGRIEQGGKDVELKCDRSVAYAFSRCLIIGCSVTAEISVSGGSVKFTGGDLWNDGITVSNQCKNGQ